MKEMFGISNYDLTVHKITDEGKVKEINLEEAVEELRPYTGLNDSEVAEVLKSGLRMRAFDTTYVMEV